MSLRAAYCSSHDGLAVAQDPGIDHRQRLLQLDLEHGDVLAFRDIATSGGLAIARGVFADEEMQPLGHRTGAHEGIEHLPHFPHLKARLLLDLGADAHLGFGGVEQAGGCLDQQVVVPVDEAG